MPWTGWKGIDMQKYAKGDYFKCPHCRHLDDYPVEDFVVPMTYEASSDRCDDCDGKFYVIEYEPGKFEVHKQ